MSPAQPPQSRKPPAGGCGASRKTDAAAHEVRQKIMPADALTCAQNNRTGCWLQAINRVSDQWRLLTQLSPRVSSGVPARASPGFPLEAYGNDRLRETR